jgi:hypothetical protein
LWKTELATHRDQVAQLVAEEYCVFSYVRGLTGKPVLLALDPDADAWQAIAALPDDVDVVVCHQESVEFPAVRDRVGKLVAIKSWDASETVETIVESCDGAPISDILATGSITQAVADQVRTAMRSPA